MISHFLTYSIRVLYTDTTQLTFQSLLGGMAAARVVETLARTGGFGVKVARHRMYEVRFITFQELFPSIRWHVLVSMAIIFHT